MITEGALGIEARHADLARRDFERGVEIYDAVPLVVVRVSNGSARVAAEPLSGAKERTPTFKRQRARAA